MRNRARAFIHRIACEVARRTAPHRLATGELCAYDGNAKLIMHPAGVEVRLAIGGKPIALATQGDVLAVYTAAAELRRGNAPTG